LLAFRQGAEEETHSIPYSLKEIDENDYWYAVLYRVNPYI